MVGLASMSEGGSGSFDDAHDYDVDTVTCEHASIHRRAIAASGGLLRGILSFSLLPKMDLFKRTSSHVTRADAATGATTSEFVEDSAHSHAAKAVDMKKESLLPQDVKSSSFVNVVMDRKSAALVGGSEGSSSWVTGTFHLITVMIGAGVLSLPSAFALLGWLLGPLLLVLFGGECSAEALSSDVTGGAATAAQCMFLSFILIGS